jgi:poly-beta-hydroxybutyrate-responsive repressor
MDGSLGSWSRNWLVPFVLLSMQHRDIPGHDLLEKLAELGLGETHPGEVYRTLQMLEREGMAFSEKGELDYLFSRRKYGLTGEGEAYLEFLAHSLELYRKEIELFFSAFEGSAVHGVRS